MNHVAPILAGPESTNGKSITPIEKILVWLAFISGGLHYNTIINTFGICMGSCCIVVRGHQCCVFNSKKIHPISRFQSSSWYCKRVFRYCWGNFPPLICGIVDGTHCCVSAPRNDDLSYRNRKGTIIIIQLLRCFAVSNNV